MGEINGGTQNSGKLIVYFINSRVAETFNFNGVKLVHGYIYLIILITVN